jgi:hypothetical protein
MRTSVWSLLWSLRGGVSENSWSLIGRSASDFRRAEVTVHYDIRHSFLLVGNPMLGCFRSKVNIYLLYHLLFFWGKCSLIYCFPISAQCLSSPLPLALSFSHPAKNLRVSSMHEQLLVKSHLQTYWDHGFMFYYSHHRWITYVYKLSSC